MCGNCNVWMGLRLHPFWGPVGLGGCLPSLSIKLWRKLLLPMTEDGLISGYKVYKNNSTSIYRNAMLYKKFKSIKHMEADFLFIDIMFNIASVEKHLFYRLVVCNSALTRPCSCQSPRIKVSTFTGFHH